MTARTLSWKSAPAREEEAALFASDLFRMYSRFAEKKGWKVDVLDLNDTGLGGIKEIAFGLTGEDVYGSMKFESGVHRVQRVPETEAQGRVHTSAATVAVLPDVEQVDVDINPVDLEMDTFRSGGKGDRTSTKWRRQCGSPIGQAALSLFAARNAPSSRTVSGR